MRTVDDMPAHQAATDKSFAMAEYLKSRGFDAAASQLDSRAICTGRVKLLGPRYPTLQQYYHACCAGRRAVGEPTLTFLDWKEHVTKVNGKDVFDAFCRAIAHNMRPNSEKYPMEVKNEPDAIRD